MKSLPLIFVVFLFILGCIPRRPFKPDTTWFDTLWFDESPVDTEVLNKIYNAETIDDIFPYKEDSIY